ncbi:MAG: OmpA family protein [Alphaproteobacteria bacterium]|nr:OmpA family protein [Alphaproteobacteria bacterium]
MSIPFEGGSPGLARAAEGQLAALADRLNANSQERVQVNAYAEGDSPAAAKRLALSRALAVRAYLTERGIAATRIDVRAVGPTDSGPRNRVDLLPAAR